MRARAVLWLQERLAGSKAERNLVLRETAGDTHHFSAKKVVCRGRRASGRARAAAQRQQIGHNTRGTHTRTSDARGVRVQTGEKDLHSKISQRVQACVRELLLKALRLRGALTASPPRVDDE